jgi:ABC-2 type transport system ATP-binding protein
MDDDIAIKVDGISKTFKLPHEKQTSLKGAVINIFRGGSRSFERQHALKGITFDIKKGDFFGIVGRNGSGKSTLLKMLAGIYIPDTGSIQVNGKLTPFIELGVGFNPELTGRENIFLNGALLGFNRNEVKAMYNDIVEFAELERFMEQKLKNYSSGMQVRLAFSIAIRARSDILLLDEVLAVGDAAFQQKCFNYFEDLKQQKKTVVFVSHDMSAIRRFCNNAIYLNNGKLTMRGKPSKIADEYVDENIESAHKSKKNEKETPSPYRVSTKIAERTDNSILMNTSYQSADQAEMYVGISVLKDGISVAEIISLPDVVLRGNGAISYTLDASIFNGGVYYITSALFRLENRELLCVDKNQCEFVIRHQDDTKGGAIKLANTWEHVK